MHILYFHQHFSTRDGATGTRSYEMAQLLIQNGHKVTMVCGSFGPGKTGLIGPFIRSRRQGIVDNINVIEFDIQYSNSDRIFKRCLAFFKYSLASLRITLFTNYDVLFATSTPLTAGIPGIFGRWLRGKNFIFEVRDLWPELPKAMGVIKNPIILTFLKLLEWTICNSAHRCIALSPGIMDGINQIGVKNENIALIPNGCDLNVFHAEKNMKWLPEGTNNQDLIAIFAGTHGVANGLDAILDAAEVLNERGRRDIKFLLVGEGGLKKSLIERALKQRLDNVIFLDPVPKIQLANLFAVSDIGIQCLKNIPAFYYGTSPNKFFDYISAGLPVLVNYPGWVCDIIEENNCGYICSPNNPSEFADLMEEAYYNKDNLRKMGKNAKKVAKSEFDRSLLGNKWLKWVLNG